MKRRAQAQPDTSQLKQIAPDMSREHRVTIADDGVGEAVQANDVVEEGARDGGCRVQVAQWYEMGVFREPVNHC